MRGDARLLQFAWGRGILSALQVRKSMPACPGTMLLQEARDLYFAANGFTLQDYVAATFTIGFLGLTVKFPNLAERRRVVPFHDLHHVLTGYPTNWVGEAEIGVWELRAGCNSWVAYFLNG